MTFFTELKALFEKYDVIIDIKNSYSLEFASGNNIGDAVYLAVDPENDTWERAAEVISICKRG